VVLWEQPILLRHATTRRYLAVLPVDGTLKPTLVDGITEAERVRRRSCWLE